METFYCGNCTENGHTRTKLANKKKPNKRAYLLKHFSKQMTNTHARSHISIQGVPESIDYISWDDGRTPDEQKNNLKGGRGVLNATLGRYRQKAGFLTNFTKKNLEKSGLHFGSISCMAEL